MLFLLPLFQKCSYISSSSSASYITVYINDCISCMMPQNKASHAYIFSTRHELCGNHEETSLFTKGGPQNLGKYDDVIDFTHSI